MNKHTIKNRQAGVSLMLSILILAAVTAISFSFATIVFIELRASGDVLRTEPALHATVGVTEEALFQYKRFVNEREDGSGVKTLDVADCYPSTGAICSLGGVTLTLPGSQPLDFDTSPALITVLAGETKVIPLYLLNNFDLLYESIDIQLIPNGVTQTLNVYLDVTTQDDSQPGNTSVNSTFGIGDTADLTNFMVNGEQYDLVLDNSSGTQNFLVNIESRASSDAPAPYNQNDLMGLPFVGQKALRIVAEYQGLTRAYSVKIPVP